MSSIGDDLRRHRESKRILLEQAAQDTKIGTRYLKAIEENRFEILPGSVYAKAYIRLYAVFLGLDPEDLSRRYQSLITPAPMDVLVTEEPTPSVRYPHRRPYSISSIAAVLLIAAGIYISRQDNPRWLKFFDRNDSRYSDQTHSSNVRLTEPPRTMPVLTTDSKPTNATPAAPIAPDQSSDHTTIERQVTNPPEAAAASPGKELRSPIEIHENRSQVVPVTIQNEDLVSSPTPSSPSLNGLMTLEVLANSRCWIEAYADQARAVGTVIDMGQKLDLHAHNSFLVTLGSAGAVDLRLNGQSMKRLGRLGEVKQITITAENYKEFLH
ncbi:MAG: DUF4115 domain-containing protein [Acidobacteria bacterium]|nr:DUF4115 domain-containing protein [Acidobacteriota bacterium]MBI3657828.1 DUF4115 domain-containing protein [Acidobacteriota bacterium]